MNDVIDVAAVPFAYPFATGGRTALVIIDMQRDFVEPGGFGASLGHDVTLLHAAIAPISRRAPATWTRSGITNSRCDTRRRAVVVAAVAEAEAARLHSRNRRAVVGSISDRRRRC